MVAEVPQSIEFEVSNSFSGVYVFYYHQESLLFELFFHFKQHIYVVKLQRGVDFWQCSGMI